MKTTKPAKRQPAKPVDAQDCPKGHMHDVFALRLALLKELEWGHYSESAGVYRCLICGCARVEGHAEDCRMSIALDV